MSTHSIGFYEDLTKLSLNYHQRTSNTHLNSSSAFISKIKTLLSLQAGSVVLYLVGNLRQVFL